jgi:hypothetical protein
MQVAEKKRVIRGDVIKPVLPSTTSPSVSYRIFHDNFMQNLLQMKLTAEASDIFSVPTVDEHFFLKKELLQLRQHATQQTSP